MNEGFYRLLADLDWDLRYCQWLCRHSIYPQYNGGICGWCGKRHRKGLLHMIVASIFPHQFSYTLPIFHFGDRVRVFNRDTGEVRFVGNITILHYPGDEYPPEMRRLFDLMRSEHMLSYSPHELYILGRVETDEPDPIDEDRNHYVFLHPQYDIVELLPLDVPFNQRKGYEPGKYD